MLSSARLLGIALWLLATLFVLPVSAQSDKDLARARQLYNQGLTQEAAGDWAGALATFEEVARIKISPQVRFHVARSKEHLGRLNEALGGYRLAEYEAGELGGKAKELLSEVQTAREALEKRIPKLVIERGEGAGAGRIALDGVVLGEAQIGTEVNVDPGPHVIALSLPSGKRVTRTVELAEGSTEHVTLEGPTDAASSSPETPTASESDDVVLDTGSATPRPEADEGSALPWIIGGVGVASLAASAIFYTMKNDAESELESGCLGRTCPDTLEDTQSRGETYATLTGVTLGVGVVGVGVAAVLLLTGRSSEPEPKLGAFSVGVRPGEHSTLVDVGARF